MQNFRRWMVVAGILLSAASAGAQYNPQGGRTAAEENNKQAEHDRDVKNAMEQARPTSNASDPMNTKPASTSSGTPKYEPNYVPVLNAPYKRKFENTETAADQRLIGMRQRGEYMELAESYYFGRGVAVSKPMAYDYYEEAARKNPHAGFLAGRMRFNGDGVTKNEFVAYPLLTSAAARGDADARAFLREHPEPVRHIGEFPKMESFAMDGYMARSVGLKPVSPIEIENLKAEIAKARKKKGDWTTTKLDGNVAMAAGLALMYGAGVPVDLDAADYMLTLAEAKGVNGAGRARAWVAWKGSTYGPSRMLSILNEAPASEQSGEMAYMYAFGFDNDPSRRKVFLMGAVERGYTQALTDLGIMELEGNGGDPNDAAGLAHLRAGAAAGNRNAMYVLGLIYERGNHGVATDKVKAQAWFAAAAKDGQLDAKKKLDEGFDLNSYIENYKK